MVSISRHHCRAALEEAFQSAISGVQSRRTPPPRRAPQTAPKVSKKFSRWTESKAASSSWPIHSEAGGGLSARKSCAIRDLKVCPELAAWEPMACNTSLPTCSVHDELPEMTTSFLGSSADPPVESATQRHRTARPACAEKNRGQDFRCTHEVAWAVAQELKLSYHDMDLQ